MKLPYFNGREYHPSAKLDENGHTLFMNNQYVKGTIGYNGNIYEDAFMGTASSSIKISKPITTQIK